jgi:hypothetical protein
MGQAWKYTPIIPALRNLRLGYLGTRCVKINLNIKGLEGSLVVEHFSSMCKVLSFIPNITKKERGGKEGEGEGGRERGREGEREREREREKCISL